MEHSDGGGPGGVTAWAIANVAASSPVATRVAKLSLNGLAILVIGLVPGLLMSLCVTALAL